MRFSFIRLVAVASVMACLAAPVSADGNQVAHGQVILVEGFYYVSLYGESPEMAPVQRFGSWSEVTDFLDRGGRV